ncbi:MAG: hypothetical protein VX519_01295, partial [Myxococcota bacterium]|nr:hypothetical protein [Myxococcota bacterium]
LSSNLMHLLLLVACARNPMPEGVLLGEWVLSAEGVRGELQIQASGCELGLWSPAWRVGRDGPVGCAVEMLEGTTWIHFPLEMGAGQGQGVIELEQDVARLPLGVRPGEWDVRLDRKAGTLPADTREQWISKSEEGLALEQAAWSSGLFRLMDAGQLVGSVELSGEPKVDLYDRFWTTGEPVGALLLEQGPDLVLEFPVMPSLRGEGGVLRVNRPTRQVVVPLATSPIDGERRLKIEPGTVSESEREAVMKEASSLAQKRELDVMLPLVRDLYAGVLEQDCRLEESLKQKTDLLLAGYTISTENGSQGCRLDVEPTPPQHGRRAAIRVLRGGELEWVFRP